MRWSLNSSWLDIRWWQLTVTTDGLKASSRRCRSFSTSEILQMPAGLQIRTVSHAPSSMTSSWHFRTIARSLCSERLPLPSARFVLLSSAEGHGTLWCKWHRLWKAFQFLERNTDLVPISNLNRHEAPHGIGKQKEKDIRNNLLPLFLKVKDGERKQRFWNDIPTTTLSPDLVITDDEDQSFVEQCCGVEC